MLRLPFSALFVQLLVDFISFSPDTAARVHGAGNSPAGLAIRLGAASRQVAAFVFEILQKLFGMRKTSFNSL